MNILKFAPAVFAVDEEYQIMAVADCDATFCVKVGDKSFFDHSNGVLRSHVYAHKVSVPKKELEQAGKYTVCMRKIIERTTYFPKLEEEVCETFEFFAPKGGKTLAYHIADAHNLTAEPILAAHTFEKEYGKLDFLILNGDVPEDSSCIENLDNVYKIISDITHGTIPVVFSRGNHDMRGLLAEKFVDSTPTCSGNSYFTFRMGDVWGFVLDSGEDKDDGSIEYGGTICCHDFRMAETEYIESVIQNSDDEYGADGVKHKIIITHNPFTRQKSVDIFDIEAELFTLWGKLLRENVQPEVMICGHRHEISIEMPGDEHDAYGHPCPVVVGSKLEFEKKYFVGTGFVFSDNGVEAVFTDSLGEIIGREQI